MSLSAHAGKPGLRLRRWDQSGLIATAGGVSMTGDWLDLESGIQVKFAEGSYRSGDYWLIPARTATGEIEWPSSQNPQPPVGISHHYCRLALIRKSQKQIIFRDDCRRLFRNLTDTEDTPSEQSIHITAVRLRSGDEPARILLNGAEVQSFRDIELECDMAVAQESVTTASCFVTLDVPFREAPREPGLTPEAYIPLIVGSSVITDGRVITWKANQNAISLKTPWLAQITQNSALNILVRLTVKDSFIWAKDNPELRLDGEGFAMPKSSENPRLPSGNGKRGGDFEMWFWLIQLKPARVTDATLVTIPAVRSDLSRLATKLPNTVLINFDKLVSRR